MSKTKQTCRNVVKLLEDDSHKLIRRFVSSPRMTRGELKGSQDFWAIILKDVEKKCKCKFPKTKKAIKDAYRFYRTRKEGKAAWRIAQAGQSLSTEAKKCSLK